MPFRVFFYCHMNGSYPQLLLKGIARVASRRGWTFQWGDDSHFLQDLAPQLDGVLVFQLPPEILSSLNSRGLPLVSVSSRNADGIIPCVYPSDRGIAQRALAHFQDRFFNSYAFVGLEGLSLHQHRLEAFEAEIDGACPVCWVKDPGELLSGDPVLGEFLSQLPVHSAVYAPSDYMALRVCNALARTSRRVAYDIAVLGVDADEIIGYSSPLSLSSVDTLPVDVGEKAAEILDEWMKGRPPPPGKHVEIDPGDVVCRQSTDGFATQDLAVQRAVRLLREDCCGKVDFETLARNCGVGRRSLEIRFKAALGEGMSMFVSKERLRRAASLLIESSQTLSEIADHCGFSTPAYFSDAFKKHFGESPLRYRQKRVRLFRTAR